MALAECLARDVAAKQPAIFSAFVTTVFPLTCNTEND